MTVVFARELARLLRSPATYFTAAAFLAIQALLFVAVVELLSDPSRVVAFDGMVARYFGGNVLFWLVYFAVVAVATMATIAGERQAGSWEVLLTSSVSEFGAVVGKWLASAVFVFSLWLSTATFFFVVAIVTPASVDVPALVSAILGVAWVTAAVTGIGVASSAVAGTPMIAGLVTVLVLVSWLLLGELAVVFPSAGAMSAAFEHVDLRDHVQAAARGALQLDRWVLLATTTAVSLVVAFAGSGRGRLRRRRHRQRWLAVAVCGLTAVLWNVLAARHPVAIDISAQGRNELAPETHAAVSELDANVELALLRPSFAHFDMAFSEVGRVAEALVNTSPKISLRRLDALDDAAEIAAIAREVAADEAQVSEGGIVVVRSGSRRMTLDLLDLVDFGRDRLGAGTVVALHAERELVRAMVQVTAAVVPTVCFTNESLELSTPRPRQRAVALVRASLERAGLAMELLEQLTTFIPSHCDVVAVVGPLLPQPETLERALAEYAAGGGSLFIAVSPDGSATGLGLAMAEHGVAFASGVVVDEEQQLGAAERWATSRGYAANHPITRRFFDRRTTVWRAPRPIVAAPAADVVAIVATSPSGQVRSSAIAGSAAVVDTDGPVAVAVAHQRTRGGRLVAWGGGAGDELTLPYANQELLVQSLRWLAFDAEPSIGVPQWAVRDDRIVMASRERRLLFLLLVISLPALMLLGGAIAWKRGRGV